MKKLLVLVKNWFRRMLKKKKRKIIDGPIKDYLVPLRHNRWFQITLFLTLYGAFCSILAIYQNYHSAEIAYSAYVAICLFIIGFVVLGFTEFGAGSVRAYREVKAHINKNGTLHHYFLYKYTKSMYCSKVGAKVAADEHGSGFDLHPDFFKPW